MIAAFILQYNFSDCRIQGNRNEPMRKLKYVFIFQINKRGQQGGTQS